MWSGGFEDEADLVSGGPAVLEDVLEGYEVLKIDGSDAEFLVKFAVGGGKCGLTMFDAPTRGQPDGLPGVLVVPINKQHFRVPAKQVDRSRADMAGRCAHVEKERRACRRVNARR